MKLSLAARALVAKWASNSTSQRGAGAGKNKQHFTQRGEDQVRMPRPLVTTSLPTPAKLPSPAAEPPAQSSLSAQAALSPKMLTMRELTDTERNVTRMIKVTCLVVIAMAVVYTAMDRLEAILIPFVLALALSYLLKPMIDCFSCANASQSCHYRLPRPVAVLLALFVAVLVLLGLGLVIVSALTTFRERSQVYRQRMEEMLEAAFGAAERLQRNFARVTSTSTPYEAWRTDATDATSHAGHSRLQEASEIVEGFVKDISVTNLILQLLGTAARVAEDLMCMLLHGSEQLLAHYFHSR